MLGSIGIAVTGLDAASKKLYASTSNIVNSRSEGTLDGSGRQAYTPIEAQSRSVNGGGVSTSFVGRQPAFVPSFQPDSPFANTEGFVAAPNVNVTEELINAKDAEHAYKANALLIDKAQDLAETLLDAFDEDV